MGNRKVIVESDYTQNDLEGPFHKVRSIDTMVDASGNPIYPESQITVTSSTYTITDTFKNILVNPASNNIALTLPTAVNRSNKIFSIKRIDSSESHSVTITSAGGTIDGQTSIGMVLYSSYKFISNGTNWYIL